MGSGLNGRLRRAARHDTRTEGAPLSIAGKLVGREHVAAASAAHSSRNHGDSRGTIQDFVYRAGVLQRGVDPAGNHPARILVPELEPAFGRQDSQKAPRHLLLFIQDMIANPPFSLDEWGREVAESDGHGRFPFGVPPKTKGDLAFVQHMVAVLNAKGSLGVVMPHGVLFRGSAEGKIRRGLLQEDLFEAVIGLPPNLFYGTGIPASILVLNRDKPRPREGNLLFIDASGEFDEGSNQNRLRDQDIEAHLRDVPRLRRRRQGLPGRTSRRDRCHSLLGGRRH